MFLLLGFVTDKYFDIAIPIRVSVEKIRVEVYISCFRLNLQLIPGLNYNYVEITDW